MTNSIQLIPVRKPLRIKVTMGGRVGDNQRPDWAPTGDNSTCINHWSLLGTIRDYYRLNDGRGVCVWTNNRGVDYWYELHESPAHMERYRMTEAFVDIEGRGGRFFPSDYTRLKIALQDDPSDVSVTGRVHNPRCIDTATGDVIPYRETRYAWSDQTGYVPFSQKSYDRIFGWDEDAHQELTNPPASLKPDPATWSDADHAAVEGGGA